MCPAVPKPPPAVQVYGWARTLIAAGLDVMAYSEHERLSHGEAVVVRDAAMLCISIALAASLCPRSKVLVEAKATQHAGLPCREAGCTAPGCTGIRFEDSRYTPGTMQLVVPHSKTTSSQSIPGPVLQITDPQHVQLLKQYERRARPALVMMRDAREEPLSMFLTEDGEMWTYSKLHRWFQNLQR